MFILFISQVQLLSQIFRDICFPELSNPFLLHKKNIQKFEFRIKSPKKNVNAPRKQGRIMFYVE